YGLARVVVHSVAMGRREEDALVRLAVRPTLDNRCDVQGQRTDGVWRKGELGSAVARNPWRVEAIPSRSRLIPPLGHLVPGLCLPVVRDPQPKARVHDPRA